MFKKVIAVCFIFLFSLTHVSSSYSQVDPWNLIGRLKVKNGTKTSRCTAAVVQDDIILSSAHCFHNSKGEKVRPNNVSFLLKNETYTIKKIYLAPRYNYYDTDMVSDFSNDWAFVKLERKVPRQFGHFDIQPFEKVPLEVSGKTFFSKANFGGFGKRKQKLRRLENFKVAVIPNQSSFMFVDINIYCGDSGGPVWVYKNGKPTIIGIVKGYVKMKGKKNKEVGIATTTSFINKKFKYFNLLK